MDNDRPVPPASSGDQGAPHLFCTRCGARLQAGDQFCPACGDDVGAQAALRTAPGPASSTDDLVPFQASAHRRRRRRWFRRPAIMIPLIALLALVAIGGVTAFRTWTAFDEVNAISTPPPDISAAALGGDEDTVIDTDPAQEAVRQWEEDRERGDDTGDETGQGADPTVPGDGDAGSGEAIERDTAAPAADDETNAGPDTGASAGDATNTGEGDTPATQGSDLPPASEPASSGTSPGEDDPPITNILLMGVDARDGESIDVGVRPDSLGVLSLNEEAGTCRILAVPRDSRVTIPGYGLSKVNHALAVGGIRFEQLVLEEYLGLRIDHYALVDFSGLVAVVDALDGVRIDNPDAFSAGGHDFAVGTLTLDGDQALAYSRYRGGPDGDFGRVDRQQRVMRALIDQAAQANLVRLIPDMFDLLRDHFRTDFGPLGLVDLANTYRDSCTSETLDTRTIPGAVQTLPDDMMNMNLSFVVSSPDDVSAHVSWLLDGVDPADVETQPDATPMPAATPPSSPVATPAATPAAEGTPARRSSAGHAQG